MSTPEQDNRFPEDWLARLDKPRLPALPHVQNQVLKMLGDGNRSLREIADRLQNSPGMALYLMIEANRSGSSSLHSPAETMEQALTRLGAQRSIELLRRLPTLGQAEMPVAMAQLQLISLHAMQQADGLFTPHLARLWQEIHWSSLLFMSPLWALAWLEPERMQQWIRRVLEKAEPARQVEAELFGQPLLGLCQQLSEHWCLPAWISQGYHLLGTQHRLLVKSLHIARDYRSPLQQRQKLDADPPLQRWLTQPGNTVLLSNALAIVAHHGWYSGHMLRWQQLAGLYLQAELPDLQALSHQQAVTSARLHAVPGLWHPAQALLWPAPVSNKPLANHLPSAQELQAWRSACQQLLSSPSPFSNMAQLLAATGQALNAAGFPRTLVLFSDRPRGRLLAQHYSSLANQAKSLQLLPALNPILKQLLAKPMQLHIQQDNSARFYPLLPEELQKLFDSRHLLLRSIGAPERIALVLVVDQNKQPINDLSVQIFNKTCQCLEKALQHFNHRP